MKLKKASLALCILLILSLIITGCTATSQDKNSNNNSENISTVDEATNENAQVIELSDTSATINGEKIEEFDYTWNIDPSKEKEWYEGTKPDTNAPAYIAHDIWYYPTLNEDGFSKENYDGETEWVYHYTASGLTDYIFSTLPVLGDTLPKEMMHSSDEAYKNPVLHITQAGTYKLKGNWHGQVMVDLGDKDETFSDENAKVTLILDGVDITCDCAPGVLIYSAYECDNTWEDSDSHSGTVDTTNAGANIEIASGSVNNVTGANVYRLLKAEYKKNSTTVQKKSHKTDGAFYSFVSMNINGSDSGILNITSTTYEGLDSELHLTINGGNINIYSQDDAVNVNEDNVSVFTMNNGVLHIFAGLGAEGDGIDSNGYITVNGGTIAGGTPSGSDSLLDADCDVKENGGNVIVIGSSNATGGNFHGGMTPPDGDKEFRKMTPPDGEEAPNGMTPPDGMTPPNAVSN